MVVCILVAALYRAALTNRLWKYHGHFHQKFVFFYFPCFFSIYMNQTEILLSNIEWISFSSKNWMRTCFHIFILKWSRTTMSKFKNDRVWYLNKSFPCYCDSNYVQILEIILEKKKQQHLCKGNSLCNCKMYSLIKKNNLILR